jgi:hypothetical protein
MASLAVWWSGASTNEEVCARHRFVQLCRAGTSAEAHLSSSQACGFATACSRRNSSRSPANRQQPHSSDHFTGLQLRCAVGYSLLQLPTNSSESNSQQPAASESNSHQPANPTANS